MSDSRHKGNIAMLRPSEVWQKDWDQWVIAAGGVSALHFLQYFDLFFEGTETVQVTPLRRTLASSP